MFLRTRAFADFNAPSWTAIGVSVIGTGHIARGSSCQDAHGGLTLADGSLLLAVADGAGSAKLSELGASNAVETALRSLQHSLTYKPPLDEGSWNAVLTLALEEAQGRLLELSNDTPGSSVGDFATTLLLVAITPTSVASLQVGDGAVVLRHGETLRVLSSPSTAEYINETTFITSANAKKSAMLTVEPSDAVDAVALLSDGVQFLAIEYSTNTAHAPFFNPVFEFTRGSIADPGELEAMLSSERVNELTDDDKTLVVAVRNREIA